VDQNRKPGVPPTKDISDLKARLGLQRPAAGPAPGAPGPAGARPAPAPTLTGPGFPQQPGRPAAAPAPAARPQAAPAAAPPAGHNPYANMKAPTGGFDLRTIDDGAPVANVSGSRSKAALVASVVVGVAAFALGAGMGMANVARANMNTANHAAKAVKTELENMQKTLGQIGAAVYASQQRLGKDKKDPLSYDPQFVADLERVKLDPRPNTATIFRVDYYRLPDADVDKLFNYYYDTIALYGEVERHIRKSHADQESLKAFAEKSAGTQNKNYGIVFDNSAGKIVVANLVEIGDQVCKSDKGDAKGDAKGPHECAANDFKGFKVRSNTGAPWVDRTSGAKLDLGNVIPMKPTPLMDAVMSGSTDQVRQETYKQRVAAIRGALARITATQKDLMEGIGKDASRPDQFAPF
jgi:hypothetical protein